MQCRYINLDQIALAEHGLVHPRDLELEYYVAFLSRRSGYTDVLQAHYVSTRTNYATIHPIHQKLQLLSCFRNQLADHATFMMGNWCAPNSSFHKPSIVCFFKGFFRNMAFMFFRLMNFVQVNIVQILKKWLWKHFEWHLTLIPIEDKPSRKLLDTAY